MGTVNTCECIRISKSVKDIKFEKYTNIIFDKNVCKARKVIRYYLNDLNIITIGRFNEWDYLCTNQSFLSGHNIL